MEGALRSLVARILYPELRRDEQVLARHAALGDGCTHPLAGCESVDLAEVDGETFLLHTGIGFWRDLCREHLSASRFMEQDDYIVFSQQAAHSWLCAMARPT